MTITRLDHVNIRTTQLKAMTAWYEDVLGLVSGKRPNFPFDGAWLYAGNVAIVHLVDDADETAIGSEASLKLEHFAVRSSGRAQDFEAKLTKRGELFRRKDIESFDLTQYNIWDPDGNHIHVDFDLRS